MRTPACAARADARHRVGGSHHRGAASEIERHAASLGLVQDVGRADFQRDRKPIASAAAATSAALATALLFGSAMP